MAEEKIKLALDYGESKKATIDVAGALDKVKAAASAVGNEAFAELIGKSAEMVTKLRETAKEAKEGGEKTKLGLADIGAGASSLFSAFSSGNVGGVIKGVSGLVALVPALNTFAPAIKLAGDMADTAWPLLKDWYEYLDKANKKMVDNTKSLGDYAKALRDSNAALKESDEYAKAKAADKEAAAEVPKKAKDRGEIFSELTKGRQAETLKETFDAVHKDREDERDDEIEAIKKKAAKSLKEYTDRSGDTSGPIYKGFKATYDARARQEIDKVQSGAKDQGIAEELLTKARAGDADAIKKLRAILPDDSTTAQVARMSSPEAQDEAREEKRYLADQQKLRAERQKQAGEKQAANDQVQTRIKQDMAAQDAKAIERSNNTARGQAVIDAGKEASNKFFEGGEDVRGAGLRRPGSANDAQQETIFNRLHDRAAKKAPRRQPANHGKRPRRSPSREQERSAPPQSNDMLIKAMEFVTANQAGAAQNDTQRIEQIIQSSRNTGKVQAQNRSSASSGFAS